MFLLRNKKSFFCYALISYTLINLSPKSGMKKSLSYLVGQEAYILHQGLPQPYFVHVLAANLFYAIKCFNFITSADKMSTTSDNSHEISSHIYNRRPSVFHKH